MAVDIRCAGQRDKPAKITTTRRRTKMTSTSLSALREEFRRCRDMDASLNERLAAYSGVVRRVIPSYADAVDELVERLAENGAGANAPRPGDTMPPFLLPDENGRLVALDDLLLDGPAAITFHRGHWCPWCRISARALAQAQDRIRRAGAQAAAIIPEPDLERLLSSFGRKVPEYQANDSWMLPIPATFVVGRNSLVTARFLDPDFRRRATVEDLIGALEAAV
jgi:peroxiredoxin